MPNDFAGIIPKTGESTDIIKPLDLTPAPPSPATPKPPEGWDKMSYKHARQMRK